MWQNQFKASVFQVAIGFFVCCICYKIGGLRGFLVGSCITIGVVTLSYRYFDKLVFSIYKAQPLDSIRYAYMYRTLGELCAEMGMPVPALWYMSSSFACVFSLGRSPRHASLAVSKGLLVLLDERELRAVLAHELCHIKDGDIAINSVVVAWAAVISCVATVVEWFLPKAYAAGPFLGIAALIVGLIMPIPAAFIKLLLSRKREFVVDESAACLVQDPLSLASALGKLNELAESMHAVPPTPVHATIASIFIVYPFTAGPMISLFSTHPPAGERIVKLREIARREWLQY